MLLSLVMKKPALAIFLILGALNILTFQNCSKVGFTADQGAAAGNDQFGNPQQPPGINLALTTLQPALASRATGCIMCHANISSNVITDFGFGGDGNGTNYFFGGTAAVLPSGLTNTKGGSVYGDYDTTVANNTTNWSAVNMTGAKVIVPQASTSEVSVSSPTLASYLRSQLSVSANATTQQVTVQEAKAVFIGAPTEERIRTIGHLAGAPFKYFPTSQTSPALAGLIVGASADVLTNSSQGITCEGDLVLDRVLWLNNATLNTETGCHIYSTKSVFITGPVTYSSTSENRNLQISSARAVSLGLGHACNGGVDSIAGRLTIGNESRFNGFFTRSGASPANLLAMIKADADSIGTLQDATCGPQARAVGYDRLLLNAPVIESRYQGLFSGALIAEITLTSLGSLKFEFDPIFAKASVLPLLTPDDYLNVDPM
jgi:hypothetical protein